MPNSDTLASPYLLLGVAISHVHYYLHVPTYHVRDEHVTVPHMFDRPRAQANKNALVVMATMMRDLE
jgi:hypothetical protein